MSKPPKFDDTPSSPQGMSISPSSPAEMRRVIDQAFDYRGDVTIHTRDGRTVTGYVFDRQCDDADNDRTYMRIIAADGDDRITLYDADVLTVTFTGRDPAAGKSWEAWVKRYIENKTKDEAANIEPESLE